MPQALVVAKLTVQVAVVTWRGRPGPRLPLSAVALRTHTETGCPRVVNSAKDVVKRHALRGATEHDGPMFAIGNNWANVSNAIIMPRLAIQVARGSVALRFDSPATTGTVGYPEVPSGQVRKDS